MIAAYVVTAVVLGGYARALVFAAPARRERAARLGRRGRDRRHWVTSTPPPCDARRCVPTAAAAEVVRLRRARRGRPRLPRHHRGRHRREPRLLLGAQGRAGRGPEGGGGHHPPRGPGGGGLGEVGRAAPPTSSSTSPTARRTVHVVSKGVPPQLFRDRIGVVVEGTMTTGGPLREPPAHGLARQPVPHPRGQERGHQDPHALDPRAGRADAPQPRTAASPRP